MSDDGWRPDAEERLAELEAQGSFSLLDVAAAVVAPEPELRPQHAQPKLRRQQCKILGGTRRQEAGET